MDFLKFADFEGMEEKKRSGISGNFGKKKKFTCKGLTDVKF